MDFAPSKRIVDVLYKFVMNNLLSTGDWRETLCELLEAMKVLSEINIWDVHDDVKQRNCGTSVSGGLICEPDVIRASALLLNEVVFDITEEEDKTVHGLPIGIE